MHIIITMAGESNRFKEAGYNEKKYKLMVQDNTIFYWSMKSLEQFFDCPFVFVTLLEDGANNFIHEECAKLGIGDYMIQQIPNKTDGQASTVALALKHVKSDFIVYNIDTYVDPKFLSPDMIRGAGWVPCFNGDGDKWSFVEIDKKNIAIRVKEKERISDNATIGLYYFESRKSFNHAYNGTKQDSEKYIAPLYNYMINKGRKVFVSILPKEAVIPLGTPEDLVSAQQYKF